MEVESAIATLRGLLVTNDKHGHQLKDELKAEASEAIGTIESFFKSVGNSNGKGKSKKKKADATDPGEGTGPDSGQENMDTE